MRYIKYLAFLMCALSSTIANCETHVFPKGEIPSLSLVQAIQICENIAKKIGIDGLNPISARLMGDQVESSGAWIISHSGKNGQSYQFSVFFPKNICYVYDDSADSPPNGAGRAFQHDGVVIPLADKTKREPDIFDQMEREQSPK